MRSRITILVIAVIAAWALTAWATSGVEQPQSSGFLSDYSPLEPVPGNPAVRIYLSPKAPEVLKEYKSAFIEQAEIFIAPDSPYKGIKPDSMKLLADTFSGIVQDELKNIYTIAPENGPGVLRFRFAVSDVILHRKISKNPLAYTPLGATIHYTREALTRDVTKKLNLSQATLELEILDGGTDEVIGAGTERHVGREIQPAGEEGEKTSWKEVERSMHVSAARLRCRIENMSLPEDQRADCLEVGGNDGAHGGDHER